MVLVHRLSYCSTVPSRSCLKMLEGKGVRAVTVMWVMTFFSFVMVPLRLYTRIYVNRAIGLDDHVFMLAWVCSPLFEKSPPRES